MTNELRKRKETPAIESNAQDAETISQAITKPDDQEKEQVKEAEEKELSETNDDKDTETSESVKTHIDKKNE